MRAELVETATLRGPHKHRIAACPSLQHVMTGSWSPSTHWEKVARAGDEGLGRVAANSRTHNAQTPHAAAETRHLLPKVEGSGYRARLAIISRARASHGAAWCVGRSCLSSTTAKPPTLMQTAKALASHGNDLHWIVGGQPKDGGIDEPQTVLSPCGPCLSYWHAARNLPRRLKRSIRSRLRRGNRVIRIMECGTLDSAVGR